jgi:hypothetical protein
MRRMFVDEWMGLDGFAWAPIEPQEDTSGGFKYGGWHLPFAEQAFQT